MKKEIKMKITTKLYNRIGTVLLFLSMQTVIASLTEINQGTMSPLHKAVKTGDVSAVETLINAGAGKNAADKKGSTPLHWAVYNGYRAIVGILLRAGANTTVVDNVGNTPLHWAAYKGHGKIAKMLLRKNADTAVVSIRGGTPLHYAAQEGHGTVIEILLKGGADMTAITKKDSSTPLHYAANNGHEVAVETLLKAGADKNAVSKGGWTPLHLAAQNGYGAVVEMLLRAGARTEQKSISGKTPLFHALTTAVRKSKVTQYQEVISMLLLVGNASLEDAQNLSREEHNLLERWGFEYPAFASAFEQSKTLLQEYFLTLIHDFESCHIPTAIASLIIGYHDCIDTRMLLFKKAKSLSIWQRI